MNRLHPQNVCQERIRTTPWRRWKAALLSFSLFLASMRPSKADISAPTVNDLFVLCRLTMQDTMFQDPETGRMYGEEEIVCDPHDDQHDNLYTIPSLPETLLPDHVVTANAAQLGNVWVNITAAHVDDVTEQVVLNPALSTFTVVPAPSNGEVGRRRLYKAFDQAIGVRTYAIILISTTDVQPSVTEQAMRARFTNPAVGMEAQYAACSDNQLQWQLQGIYQVDLPKTMADYGSAPSTLRNEATTQFLQDNGLASMQDLADNTLFCIPPGTGTWVANAGTFYWRSQYNAQWCISLTAVVHELGHNLGLGHSNENGQPYADWTGYMASGLPDQDKPKKCFNAANHAQLKWFEDRTRTWDASEGSRLIKVAGFVHYAQTTTAEPVILQFGRFYGQYNLAVQHNQGTEEYADEFVLVEQVEGATELRTHLQVGQSVRISGTSIHVCGTVKSSPKSLLVGIGSVSLADSPSLCNLPVENFPPTSQPTNPPTIQPTDPPTPQPTNPPTPRPTVQPTSRPTDKPTNKPTVEPTRDPSQQPTNDPTQQPTNDPTQQPSHTPTVKPTTGIGAEADSSGGSGLVVNQPPPTPLPTEAPTEPPTTPLLTEAPTEHANVFDKPINTVAPSSTLGQGESEQTPSKEPTLEPSSLPSLEPSTLPSSEPSAESSIEPSREPSQIPSKLPSEDPSATPSDAPSYQLPTTPPTETIVETNPPVMGVQVQPDGSTTSASEATADAAKEAEKESPDDAKTSANGFLEAWEKLAVGTTWFEYFL